MFGFKCLLLFFNVELLIICGIFNSEQPFEGNLSDLDNQLGKPI